MKRSIICFLFVLLISIPSGGAENQLDYNLMLPMFSEIAEEQAIQYMKNALQEKLSVHDPLSEESPSEKEENPFFSSGYKYIAIEQVDYIWAYDMIYPKEKANTWEVYAFEDEAPYSYWMAEFYADGEIHRDLSYYGTSFTPIISDIEAAAYAFAFLKEEIGAILTEDTNTARNENGIAEIIVSCTDYYLGLEVEQMYAWRFGKRCIPIFFFCQDSDGAACITQWWFMTIERLEDMNWLIRLYKEDLQAGNAISASRLGLYSFDYYWFPSEDQLVFSVQIDQENGETTWYTN